MVQVLVSCDLRFFFWLQLTFFFVCSFLLKVLCKYYPEVTITNPSIGRQGKGLRRRQQRKVESPLHHKEIMCPSLHSNTKGSFPNIESTELETGK